MTAFANALSRTTGIDADYYSAQLKTIAIFCGVVLFYRCSLPPMG
jgi:hypothetical protein